MSLSYWLFLHIYFYLRSQAVFSKINFMNLWYELLIMKWWNMDLNWWIIKHIQYHFNNMLHAKCALDHIFMCINIFLLYYNWQTDMNAMECVWISYIKWKKFFKKKRNDLIVDRVENWMKWAQDKYISMYSLHVETTKKKVVKSRIVVHGTQSTLFEYNIEIYCCWM